MRNYYKNDPHWLTAKFGACEECHANLKGKRAYYYPKGRNIYCESCGESRSSEFESYAQDEYAYAQGYGV